MQMNEVRDTLDTLVRVQDFTQAAVYKQRLTELESQRDALVADKEAKNRTQEVAVEKVGCMG